MSGNPWYRLNMFRMALRIAAVLPRPMAQEIASYVGPFCSRFVHKGREAGRRNMARIAGLPDGPMLDELCRENLAHFGRNIADYFYCSLASPDEIRALVETWLGFENLTAAREAGKGGILITAHLGNWELGGLILALAGVPLTVITLQEPTTELTQWREACRRRLGVKTIAIGDADPFSFVGIVSALRRNEFVAMLVDRPSGDAAEPVRFFGAETRFSTAPTLLHRHTGAAVIPAFVLQNPGGRYVSLLEKPVPMGPDAAANAQRIATVFESVVRRHPEQWFNYVPIWK